MCDCINMTNALLKDGGHILNTTLGLLSRAPSRAIISLVRLDKYVLENRASKPKHILANFCPFCGEKYQIPEGKSA